MNGGIVGKRYAKALLNLAGTHEKIEKIGQQLQNVAELYINSVEMRNVINEPKINKTKKIGLVDQLTQKLNCGDLVNKYCRYLTSRNRFDRVADISAAFNSLAGEKIGIATATVTVAKKLTEKEEINLQEQLTQLTGKKIDLVVEVDPSIIGGAVTTIESLVLDGSIKNKLNLIRETISKGI